jgi:integration host factor subunit beta
MNKSDLVHKVSKKLVHLTKSDVDEAIHKLTDLISTTLIKKDRVEIRGFGSFSTRKRTARLARNPKTGSSITVSSKFHPYFRASKSLRKTLNN